MIATGRTLIGVDPGKTSGIFCLRPDGGIHAVELEQWIDVPGYLLELDGDAWIFERFIIGPQTLRKRFFYEAIWCEGAIRCAAVTAGIAAVSQLPAARLAATDNILKHVGWYRPGRRHAMDAARHLLIWLVGQGEINIDDLRAATQ